MHVFNRLEGLDLAEFDDGLRLGSADVFHLRQHRIAGGIDVDALRFVLGMERARTQHTYQQDSNQGNNFQAPQTEGHFVPDFG